MTYRECYAYGMDELSEAGIADAKIDARMLLEFVCGTSQHDMLLNGNREVKEADEVAYKACIAKRSERIPLQHITGEQSFMGFDFGVNEHVLIPRQDTEVLVEENTVTINPVSFHRPTKILSGHNDHRIVMSLAVLLTLTGGKIEGAEAVQKSFPDFFSKLQSLGIQVQKEDNP